MEPASRGFADRLRDPRVIAGLWAAFALVVAVVKFRTLPSPGNVFNIYRDAGVRWADGVSLYDEALRFVYLPTCAALFAPWSWLPFDWGGALWRILNIAVFAVGIWRLVRHLRPDLGEASPLLVAVVSALLSWSASRHGQMTMAMAGVMMLACVDLERGRWWPAAAWLTAAVALKPLAIVLWLTCVVVYPRVLLPCLAAVGAIFGGIFVLQSPSYVLQQYAGVPDMFQRAMVRESRVWENLFGVFQTLGVEPPLLIKLSVSGVLALGVLAFACKLRKKGGGLSESFYLYAVCSAYILLLGSGTEPNTYSMLAPVIGILLAHAIGAKDRNLLLLGGGMVLVSLASSHAAKAFPGTILTMLKPLIALALAGYLLARTLPTLRLKADAPGGGGAESNTKTQSPQSDP